MAAPAEVVDVVRDAVDSTDPHLTDPPLLRDHSEFNTYESRGFKYSGIRIFYRQHAKADQLPKPPLPLLVFLHGLGGSAAQFHPLLCSLVDEAPCLAIDYPGCGRSEFSVTDWAAYTTEALVELLEIIINDYRDKDAGQRVVLIGHSMGTALSARLANTGLPHTTDLSHHVGADKATRKMQYRFNKQSRTPVWRRMANGALPVYNDGKPTGGLPTLDIWAGLDIPVFLIAGERDNVVSPKEAEKIVKVLDPDKTSPESEDGQEMHEIIVDTVARVNTSTRPQSISDLTDADFMKVKSPHVETPPEGGSSTDPSTPNETMTELPPQPSHPKKIVQSFVMPAPATHAVLYTPCSVRAVAGLISDFLATNVTGRLSLAWQLQYLSREGKWDVKNLNKWKSVNPVSDPIGPPGKPIFRALKTLREADDVHCPEEFVSKWSSIVKDVIDISKDQPVYDPRGLERAGIRYHKFPTVSKIPPLSHEIQDFIKLVDDIRQSQADRAPTEEWSDPEQCVIGVHCHYGFNRTGYFIVCYLVERCGFDVQEAIETFAKARPNGIRHSHFLDRLYVRYNV
ncbi:hypothetical protein FCULG_00006701 [Fusarium culmorum]|uniref:Tyrosine specific protein phosphatases domain-containing protein n=1 Tax=Fusarium culmorum TaxID=5516 RepID=A0A2T4GUY6_FUSCU|nr:hypothetical protein FCULG_00006701 [Fusarium culmorum]